MSARCTESTSNTPPRDNNSSSADAAMQNATATRNLEPVVPVAEKGVEHIAPAVENLGKAPQDQPPTVPAQTRQSQPHSALSPPSHWQIDPQKVIMEVSQAMLGA